MEKENNDSALKNDFLAAYHSILFSRTNVNDADIERRKLAVKYMTAKKFESEDAAAVLLQQGLKQYTTLLKKTNMLKDLYCPENHDRTKWRSSLVDPEQALSLIKPLPCQNVITDRGCGRRDLVDRDIENLIKSSAEVDDCTNERKVSIAQPGRIIPQSTSRFEREGYARSHIERYDESQMRKPIRHNWEIMEEDNARKYERSRSYRSDNETFARPQSKNRWERMEEEEVDNDDSRKCEQPSRSGAFKTAKAELHIQQQQKAGKKSLGGKASVNSKFVCPLKRDRDREEEKSYESTSRDKGEAEDERLKGIDEKLIELVRNEIIDSGTLVSWNDVAGLEHAKKIIKEIIVLPMLRPDIFTGLRRPPKGMLLFGPPGTGKTLIGKCIASQSKSTFFSISASSLTSKWIGEGEKMVRALFAVARVQQPSVIFIDEIDSLLTQRSETEHESSRRIKTEFLVQLDGAATGEEDRILVIGATNRPQELDEAARRRFVKRLYVPLPEFGARRKIVENLLASEQHDLTSRDIDNVAELSEHYSGADMTNLCKEASMGPIRSVPFELLENIRKEDLRCVTAEDFRQALTYVRPSVSQSDLGLYVDWDRTYGSGTSSIGTSKTSN